MIGNKTVPMSSRRGILAGSGTALLAGGAALAGMGMQRVQVASPDAELIRLCAEFGRLEETVDELYQHGETPIENEEAVACQIYDRQNEIAHQTYDMKDTTLEGARARAKAIMMYHGADFFDAYFVGHGLDGVLITAMIRDLVGEDLALNAGGLP
jgi:hypothetical protein